MTELSPPLELPQVKPITKPVVEKEPKIGLYLKEPHGKYIWDNKKSIIIKSIKFTSHIKERAYLISDKLCYGIIQLKEPREISIDQFKKLKDKHLITDKEFKDWNWKDKKLYSYEFTFVAWRPPKPVKIPTGPQNWIKAENIKFITPKEMSLSELEYYHSLSHVYLTLFDDFCKLHFNIANELIDRGYVHLSRAACDRVVFLIRNWRTYDPSKINDDVLRDDWRIANAWKRTVIKENKRFLSPQFKDLNLKQQKKVIKELLEKIRREMIKRGWKPKEELDELARWFDTPTQIRYRIRETPSGYQCGVKGVDTGVSFLICSPEGKPGTSKVYSIRFDKKEWDKDRAKEWIKEHKERLSELTWTLPKGMSIEDIDVPFVTKLDDKEIIEVYKFLHEEAKKGINEPIENAHVFVAIELRKRGIYEENRIDDKLTEQTEYRIKEYREVKELEELIEELEPEGELSIEQLYDAAPPNIVIPGQPYGIYFTGRASNVGKLPKGHDWDWVFRQYPDRRIVEAIHRINPKWLGKIIHPVFDPCIPIDEILVLPNGLKKAGDVKQGDLIFGHSFEYVSNINKINYQGNIYEIDPYYLQPIKVTEHHPILVIKTRKCKWQKKTCKQSCNQYRIKNCSTPYYLDYELRWAYPKELRPKDYLLIPKIRNHSLKKIDLLSYSENRRFKLDGDWIITFGSRTQRIKRYLLLNKDLAYLLGVYLAEGDNSSGLEITQKSGKVDLKILKNIAYETIGGRPRIYRKNLLVICSKILQEFLKREFGNYAKNKKIPSFIFSSPKNIIISFLQGYLDGDGSSDNMRFRFFTSSETLAKQLQIILLQLGITNFLRKEINRLSKYQYVVYIKAKNNNGKIKDIRQIGTMLDEFENYYCIPIKNIERKEYSGEIINIETLSHIIGLPFITHNSGPLIGLSYPGYRYGFFKVPKDEFIKGFGPYRLETKELAQEVKPFQKFRALKAKAGWQKWEFWKYQDLYDTWANKYLDKGIYVQKKADGRRFSVHRDGDKIQIITEDRMRDRSDELPNVEKDIRDKFKAKSFILDTEAIGYKPSKISPKNAGAKDISWEEMPREDTAYLVEDELTVGKISPDQEERLVFLVHDLLYLNGESLNNKPYSERFDKLKQVVPKDSKFFVIMPSMIAKNPRELKQAVDKMRKYKGSEGAMLKVADSIYPIKTTGENRTPEWSKFKNLKSIDVIVYNIVPKKKATGEIIPGVWEYDTAFAIPPNELKNWRESDIVTVKGKKYAKIGRTFSTSIKCKVGDIVEVLVGRIREYVKNGKHYITWMFPKFREKRVEKKEPDTLDTVRKLAKVGPGLIEKLSEPALILKLKPCPFYNVWDICPLKRRGMPLHELSKLLVEYQKYPIACPLAGIYRCPRVKKYYYGMKEYRRIKL